MSSVEELINKKCPNGVEYKTLGQLEDSGVITLGRGKVISKKDIQDNPGEYPIYSSSAVGSGIFGTYGDYMFDDVRLSWSIDGGGKFFYRDAPRYSVTNVCGWLTVNKPEELDIRYLFFALTNEWTKKVFDYVRKAHPSVIRKEYAIPVPPLEIQKEITAILDVLTDLETEMKKELTRRRSQYKYYSNELLNFKDAPYVSLEELCDIVDYRGKTPKKSSEGIFLVTAKNIRQGYIDYEKSKEYIPVETYNDVMHRGLPKIGDVLITTEAPCGYVAQVDRADIALAQRVIKYRPKDTRINSSFLKYVLLGEEFQNKLKRAATGGTVKGIKGSKLHKLTIPVPDIKIQEQVVDALDCFNELCSSIITGLPAEIEARHKQFEYYRDKLLTFKER